MSDCHRPEWRAIRFPIRLIENVYGTGNVDEAGDDIVYALRQASDYPEQYRYRFCDDCSHANPWYHEMIFEVEGILDQAYARFMSLVEELGIVDHQN